MPVELVLLPPWFPINIYAMSSWARETVVPLTVLMAKRPHDRDRADARRSTSSGCGRRRATTSPSAQPRPAHLAQRLPRPRRDAEDARQESVEAAAAPRAAPRRGVDPRPPGRERRLGRHPTADGELRDGAARARLSRFAPGGRQGPAGDRRFRHGRGRPAVLPALRVADLGHGADVKALLDSGCRRRIPALVARGRLADRQPDLQAGRLVASTTRSSSPAAGPSSSPTIGIPTSTTAR